MEKMLRKYSHFIYSIFLIHKHRKVLHGTSHYWYMIVFVLSIEDKPTGLVSSMDSFDHILVSIKIEITQQDYVSNFSNDW